MTIVRTEHSKHNPYAMLSKKSLEDTRLSWAAKGLWAYLMSRPDNWQVSIAHLAKTFGQPGENGYNRHGQGREAVSGLLRELESAGYAEFVQDREKGRFANQFWVIREEFKESSPKRAEPIAVAPMSEMPPPNKEGILKSTERNDVRASSSLVECFSKKEGLDEQVVIALEGLERDRLDVVMRRFEFEKAKGFKTNASSCVQWLIRDYDTYTERLTDAQKQAQEQAEALEAQKDVEACRSLARAVKDVFPADKFVVVLSDLYVTVSRNGANSTQLVDFTSADSKEKLQALLDVGKQWAK